MENRLQGLRLEDGCNMDGKIKKAWVTHNPDIDGFSLCFREVKSDFSKEFELNISNLILPPSEVREDGSRLDINEAKKLGVEEKSHTIGYLSYGDLILLRAAITKAIG